MITPRQSPHGYDGGLRDRALIALLVYTFARTSVAVGMNVEDVYLQGRRIWVRLHEKGGKRPPSVPPRGKRARSRKTGSTA